MKASEVASYEAEGLRCHDSFMRAKGRRRVSARLVAEINEERRRLRSTPWGRNAVATWGAIRAQQAYWEAIR